LIAQAQYLVAQAKQLEREIKSCENGQLYSELCNNIDRNQRQRDIAERRWEAINILETSILIQEQSKNDADVDVDKLFNLPYCGDGWNREHLYVASIVDTQEWKSVQDMIKLETIEYDTVEVAYKRYINEYRESCPHVRDSDYGKRFSI
jgi:hypothetical protein